MFWGAVNYLDMKAKTLLITTLLFLQVHFLFSQCISIELSVTWEMGHDIFEEDSIVYIPNLHIIYRNNCSTNFYFLKMSGSGNGLPCICYSARPHPDNIDYFLWSTNYRERAKEYFNYANDNFNVTIGGRPSFGDCWLIYNDTIDITKAGYRDVINSDLYNKYGYIYYEILKNAIFSYGFGRRDFKPSDLTVEHILDSVKDQFVFLKQGEIFIDTYNLVAFKIVEGCFTFYIAQDAIMSYVLMQEYDWEMSRFFDVEHELPAIVGEYHRYTGAFNTNKVTVCFGER